MSQPFDAYHNWLGISPKDQPPNHYRLLGIDLFESKPDVISNAADRQMVHVRSFQTGKNSNLSQKLLNEIAAAKVCLLNPAKRGVYDALLRQQLGVSAPQAKPLAVVPGQASPSPTANLDPLHFESLSGFRKTKARKKKQFPFGLVAGVAGTLVAAGIAAVLLSQASDAPTSNKTVASKPHLEEKTPMLEPVAKPAARTPAATPQPKTEPEPEPQQQPMAIPEPEPKPAAKVEPQPEPEHEAKPKERCSIPDSADQEKALITIRDIYKDDYKDPAALAKRLIEKAREAQDSKDRYVLFQEAMNLAIEGGEGEAALEAIDAIASDYEIGSVSEMKVVAMEKLAKRTRLASDQRKALAEVALDMIDEAVDRDDFDLAKQLGKLASQLAGGCKDKDLSQEVAAKNKEVTADAKALADAKEAMATLKEKPEDPEANLVVGKYLCFTKNEWERGLPLLVLSGDEKWKPVAEKDIAGASSPNEQAQIGNAWWDLSKDRARYWYKQALPDLTGLEKDRAEKRLAAEPETHSTRAPSKALLQSIIGNYTVNLVRKGKGEERCAWEFRKDGTVWGNNKQVAAWKVTNSPLQLTFSDKSKGEAVLRPRKRDQFVGTQTRANGDTWICEMQRVVVMAVWEHHWGSRSRPLTFWSNGCLDAPDSSNTWQRTGLKLVLRWGNSGVDSCTLSSDGRSYSGYNDGGTRIWGTLVPKP